MKEINIGDIITVKAHWTKGQPVKASIVSFWSKDGPFLDVRPQGLDDQMVRCVRRDDIVGFAD